MTIYIVAEDTYGYLHKKIAFSWHHPDIDEPVPEPAHAIEEALYVGEVITDKNGKVLFGNPDYKALYESIARCWASTTTRDSSSYMAQMDVHSADKLRVNRVIVTCDEFYDVFDITENDGMYVAPEDRVKVW